MKVLGPRTRKSALPGEITLTGNCRFSVFADKPGAVLIAPACQRKHSGETALWRAVLDQAMQDACTKPRIMPSGDRTFSSLETEKARDWFGPEPTLASSATALISMARQLRGIRQERDRWRRPAAALRATNELNDAHELICDLVGRYLRHAETQSSSGAGR